MLAIHRIKTLRLAHNTDHDKVEAVVAAVKTARMRLRPEVLSISCLPNASLSRSWSRSWRGQRRPKAQAARHSRKFHSPKIIERGRRHRSIGGVKARVPQRCASSGRQLGMGGRLSQEKEAPYTNSRHAHTAMDCSAHRRTKEHCNKKKL